MLRKFRGGERYNHREAMNTLQRETANVLDIALPTGGASRVVTWRDQDGRICRLESTTKIVTQLPDGLGNVLPSSRQENHFIHNTSHGGLPLEFRFQSDEKGIHFCHEDGKVMPIEPHSAQRSAIATMTRCLRAFPKSHLYEEDGKWNIDDVDWKLDEIQANYNSSERKIARKIFDIGR